MGRALCGEEEWDILRNKLLYTNLERLKKSSALSNRHLTYRQQ